MPDTTPPTPTESAAVGSPASPALLAAELEVRGAPQEGSASAWARRTFAALSNRDYRLFFLGMAISSIGTWGRHSAQQWLVYDMTGSETWLAWVSAASLLPIALVSIPAGALVDRVDKRRLLLALQIIEMALCTLLALLVGTGRIRPSHVVAIAACLGVAGGIEMPCRQAFIVEIVGKATLRNAIALNSIMFNLPLMLGPLLATMLLVHVGMTSVFVVDAVSFLASILAFARLRRLAPREVARDRAAEAPPRPLRAILEGFAFVRGSRPVAGILVLLATAMVFGWAYSSQLASFARTTLGAGASGYGILHASSGAGATLGALWIAGRPTLRPEGTLLGCLAGFSASLLAMALVPSLPVAIVARAAAGWCMIGFFATGNSTIQLLVPDRLRGRVMALWAFSFGTSLPLGQLLLGYVARRSSVPFAFGAGAVILLGAVAAYAVLRPLRGAGLAHLPTR